jgi:hypothetical protein
MILILHHMPILECVKSGTIASALEVSLIREIYSGNERCQQVILTFVAFELDTNHAVTNRR